LAQFDKRRTEFLQGLAEMRGQRGSFLFRKGMEISQPQGFGGQMGEHKAESMTRKNNQDLPVALQMPDGTRNGRKPEPGRAHFAIASHKLRAPVSIIVASVLFRVKHTLPLASRGKVSSEAAPSGSSR